MSGTDVVYGGPARQRRSKLRYPDSPTVTTACLCGLVLTFRTFLPALLQGLSLALEQYNFGASLTEVSTPLRARYGVSGTGIAYDAIILRVCYATCGTDIVCGAKRDAILPWRMAVWDVRD
eukprot:3224545-Rhodomonas_salina.3